MAKDNGASGRSSRVVEFLPLYLGVPLVPGAHGHVYDVAIEYGKLVCDENIEWISKCCRSFLVAEGRPIPLRPGVFLSSLLIAELENSCYVWNLKYECSREFVSADCLFSHP